MRNTYIAISRSIPVVGFQFKCLRLEFKDGIPTFASVTTSLVTDVVPLGNNVYQVRTCNSIYMTQIG